MCYSNNIYFYNLARILPIKQFRDYISIKISEKWKINFQLVKNHWNVARTSVPFLLTHREKKCGNYHNLTII